MLIFSETNTLFVFHLVNMILTLIGIISWARVVLISYDPRVTTENMLKSKSGDLDRVILKLIRSATKELDFYRKIQGINAIFLVCGIFPYFSFSFNLSVVLHVSRLAKRDLVSYIMIFLIIVFGFGIGGCMIYGDKLDSFKYVLSGSLEIILMTVGGVNYQEMKNIEPTVTPIFVFTYFVAAYVIFLKMFIVILDATYRELINYVVKEDITLMAYISSLLKELIKKIDFYIKAKTIDEIREKYRGNKGLIPRMKLYFEIFYDRVVKQV
jgi:hypothetical protein